MSSIPRAALRRRPRLLRLLVLDKRQSASLHSAEEAASRQPTGAVSTTWSAGTRETSTFARGEPPSIAFRVSGLLRRVPIAATESLRRRPDIRPRRFSRSAACSATALGRQQSPEERAVALQRDAQILGGDILAAAPLRLEAIALLREALGEVLHHRGHERVRILDGAARLVDEPDLDLLPAGLELVGALEERRAVCGVPVLSGRR